MNKILALTILVLAGFACSQPQKPKIVGGEDAIKNELPYQVEIQFDRSHHCGGAIINENYILTAGHCLLGIRENRFTVIAGEHDISSPTNDGTEQSRRVAKILIHENYKPELKQNDIALLKLSSPLELNSEVEPIALPKQGHLATGMALVSGWGATTITNGTDADIGPPATILKKVLVPIITKDVCKAAYVYSDNITEDMICAGSEGNSTCSGDSGGPLVASDDDGKYLVGVVSFSTGCAEAEYPTVYADVSHFVTWINQKSGQVVLRFYLRQTGFGFQ